MKVESGQRGMREEGGEGQLGGGKEVGEREGTSNIEMRKMDGERGRESCCMEWNRAMRKRGGR